MVTSPQQGFFLNKKTTEFHFSFLFFFQEEEQKAQKNCYVHGGVYKERAKRKTTKQK